MSRHSLRRGSTVAAGFALVAIITGCAATAPTSSSSAPAADTLKPPAILNEGTLSVCVANAASPPNTIFDEAGNLTGLEIDLIDAVGAELGLTINIVQSAFSALIPTLQAKQCDAIMSTLYIKPEREEVVDFVPYLKSGTALSVSEGNPKNITGLDSSMCGHTAIVTIGTTAEELTRAQSSACESDGKKAIDISTTDQPTVALQQLTNGQVDAFLETAELLGYYKSGGAKIEFAGKPFGTISVGAATRKDDTELHDAIDQAFVTLHESGSYDEILERWGAEDLAETN